MFGGQPASGPGPSSSPAPFAFGQQPNAAPTPNFGQAAPAFGQAPTAAAPAFSGSFQSAPNGFAAGTSNAAPARRKVNVRRRK